MSDQPNKSGNEANTFADGNWRESGAQNQSAPIHARRLAWHGHDGPSRLVRGGADVARRSSSAFWLDKHHPGKHAWTLALLVRRTGALGCMNAWFWVAKEEKAMREELEENDE